MTPTRTAQYDDTTHCWRIWTRHDCLEALRLACRDGVPTIKEFHTMHMVEPEIYPCVATVRQLCGGWPEAIRTIGLTPRQRGRVGQRDYEWDHIDVGYTEYRSDWD
jgi:hypothetical protein